MKRSKLGILAAIYATLVGCSDDAQTISGGLFAYEVSLAVSADGKFAAWHGGRDRNSQIYIQALDDRDRPRGQPVAVSDLARLAYEPDLIAADGRLVVAWYEKDTATGQLTAWLAGVSPDGAREWLVPLAGGGDLARNPVVRQVGDHLEVAWIEQPRSDAGDNLASIWHQRISLTGSALVAAQRIGSANRDTWNLNAAVIGERFVLVYDASLGSRAHELHMLAVSTSAAEHRRLSQDDGHASLYPDLQFGLGGRAALTWFDERDGNQEVYLAVAGLDDLGPDVTASSALRVSHTPGPSTGAYLAWNGSIIGLAWSDEGGVSRDLYAQTFTAAGKPRGPIQTIGQARETAGVPSIISDGPGFLIAWNDYVMDGAGLHGRVALSRVRLARLGLAD